MWAERVDKTSLYPLGAAPVACRCLPDPFSSSDPHVLLYRLPLGAFTHSTRDVRTRIVDELASPTYTLFRLLTGPSSHALF